MLFRSTAALITASTAGAAAWLDAENEQIKALEEYGTNIGLAFQITDDILDITSSTEELGKQVGSDAALNKITYPTLLGIEKSYELATRHIEIALKSIGLFEESIWRKAMLELAEYVLRRKK